MPPRKMVFFPDLCSTMPMTDASCLSYSLQEPAFSVTNLPLLPHPDSPTHFDGSLRVSCSLRPRGIILYYQLETSCQDFLKIPPPDLPLRTDALWRHTCLEAFARRQGAAAYHEFNISPSGQWAAYHFTEYRQNGAFLAGELPPPAISREAGSLSVQVNLPWALLPSPSSSMPLHLALSAVLESKDRALSYWSLHHPPGRPDFHHPDSFVLILPELPSGDDYAADILKEKKR